ncbi:MAG TPA: aconitate hydratase [Nitrospiraceae bacterium]|nr:MAG: aconitate hydratase [Nitrospirae bacterium GWA2_46_11]OGW23419.1 MAG: aconitate hydratase [Nitrospirae bacterium GWB2_47_37]HAK89844.1 aconitate hydratase [Nitrospiraceae bacterium]HCZ10983.1 aconitate hydratase [Nitrospiraceae bacterium]
MGKNIVQKIFEEHKVSGDITEGSLIGLKVDQVYTQDATGTMAWLEFEAIGIGRVKVPLAVSYVDHNMLQSNFMNADDHLFLQTAAAKFGAYFSKPGNGICHQVHLERFAAPGRIALGTDSHTPTGGGMGMIAVGVGGLEAATVMAGAAFEINMQKVVKINLTGRLQRPWVTAMDVILTLLKKLTVKGGVGKILEYGGEGIKGLDVTERATITNMGAELGATTSVFPSDEKTLSFLKAEGREKDWVELKADNDAEYSEIIALDLSGIEPMIAQPHSPDNVVPIREIAGKKVNQVCIGSCTNSSYQAMKTVASILKGHTVPEWLNLLINAGSKQVYEMLSREGVTADMISAGARILESSCGPCIGMGGAPGSGHISIRSYNRNFQGRSGTKDASVYLTNPIACAVMAVKGEIIDPRDAGLRVDEVKEPEKFIINDNLIIPPKPDAKDVKIIKGPNIKEVPVKEPLKKDIEAEVLLKLGANITTDDIMPAGSQVLPFRSNIPAISEFVFRNIDDTFSKRAMEAKANGGGIIIGGENYGQGSSREHAAIAPMYLGLQAVIAKSFARIHRANLINFGVLPLLFKSEGDYERIGQGDRLLIENINAAIKGDQNFEVENLTKGYSFEAASNLNDREKELILKGGLLAYARG